MPNQTVKCLAYRTKRNTGFLYNLTLSNAIRYTPTGGTITIDVVVDDRELIVSVADTGYGIPEAEQSKVFSKIFRASNVRDRIQEGSGLGLYVVKKILNTVRARMWFTSHEGQGSTFFVAWQLESE
ncbi:MAG: ATP-binding protein [bacterium]|nr:ATP-binding protein [bacterium]